MLTVKEWEENNIDLGSEIFEAVCEIWINAIYGPYEKIVGYHGIKSGQILHPDFFHVLENAL